MTAPVLAIDPGAKPKRKSRKLPTTPRSRVKNALRQVWLRSRERAACLQAAGHRCERCGVKGSAAKGREVEMTVHHRDGINWDGIVDAIIAAMLPDPSRLEALCVECHGREHAQTANAPEQAGKDGAE
jgi:5-methylcytosine-specific restriction endonuclease McrA